MHGPDEWLAIPSKLRAEAGGQNPAYRPSGILKLLIEPPSIGVKLIYEKISAQLLVSHMSIGL